MALSPASTTAVSASASGVEKTPWWSRMSTISSSGRLRAVDPLPQVGVQLRPREALHGGRGRPEQDDRAVAAARHCATVRAS